MFEDDSGEVPAWGEEERELTGGAARPGGVFFPKSGIRGSSCFALPDGNEAAERKARGQEGADRGYPTRLRDGLGLLCGFVCGDGAAGTG